MSRSGDKAKKPPAAKKEPSVKESAPPEQPAPEPTPPPRPIEEGKLVYLKLSELHAFHTFRDHPFQVKDDDKMTELVGTIKEHGVMTPTVRPEKDGQGYEIIAGHRRHHGSALAGLDEMPCIVRNITDIEAVREMKNSNKQRGEPLPSELVKLLDLEVEAIKHQGGRLDGVAAGDVGKRSISASPEGILVSDKEQSSYIKSFVDKFEQQSMFAEKSWGSFRVLDVETGSMLIKVTLNAGHRMNYYSHKNRDEVWVVISGTGKTIVDGIEQNAKAGDVITMSAGCCHTVIADTELKLIEV